MYISRRINRIFVVPAVLTMVPSYPIGEILYKEMFRTAVYAKNLELYSYPPDWQCQLAGAATALLAFAIVFFGLRGLLKLAILMSSRFKSNQNRPSEYPSWPSWDNEGFLGTELWGRGRGKLSYLTPTPWSKELKNVPLYYTRKRQTETWPL